MMSDGVTDGVMDGVIGPLVSGDLLTGGIRTSSHGHPSPPELPLLTVPHWTGVLIRGSLMDEPAPTSID